jgi:phosphatidylglycerophosphate synthase
MTRRFISIGEVAAAYRPKFAHEVRTEWAIALVYRPVSFLLTPLFAAIGVAPSTVTLLGLAIALALPFAAASGGEAWLVVGGLGVAFCVLDCIDGDLARVTGRASQRGAYLDFVVDLVYRAGLYSAIGIAADGARDGAGIAALGDYGGIVAGLASALLAILARSCRLYADSHVRDRAGPAATTRGAAFAFVSGLDHLLPFFVLAGGALGSLDWVLVWLFAYSLADFVHTQASVWKRLA